MDESLIDCVIPTTIETSVRGQSVRVSALRLGDQLIVVQGRLFRLAYRFDEGWHESHANMTDELLYQIQKINQHDQRIDVFSFSQMPSDPIPHFFYPHEYESIAAIRISSFDDWWNNSVSSDLRKDVRRSAKRGVIVKQVDFDDSLVESIKGIYDETPIRQGRKFWHYNQSIEQVKTCNSSYKDRSIFLGAFLEEELIGFTKIVQVGKMARMMQILAKDEHRDKRPMNALIAKSVETAYRLECTMLTYGNYLYRQGPDSMTAFKQRNGFEEIRVPKYFVPITARGELYVRYGLYRDGLSLLPQGVVRAMRRMWKSAFLAVGNRHGNK